MEAYRKTLAIRLLNGTSESMDTEKSLVSRLNIIVGGQYIQQMEGMFNDLDLAKDEQGVWAWLLHVHACVYVGQQEFQRATADEHLAVEFEATVRVLFLGFHHSLDVDWIGVT